MPTTEAKKEIVKGALDKVKLVDAGVKNKYGQLNSPVNPSDDYANKMSYPHLNLDTKEAPMLSGSEVGDNITLLVKATVTSHSLRESSSSPKCEDYCLEVEKIGVVSTEKGKEDNNKE